METKDRIIVETLKLFMRYGIKNITMDRLAKNLGVSKRTIYELFKDKNELIKHCINRLVADEKRITEDIISKSDNVIDAFLSRMKRSIILLRSINEVFIYDAEKYHYSVFELIGKQQDENGNNMLLGFIKQGQKDGLLRTDINEEIIAILASEQFRIIANEQIFPPYKFNLADVFENIAINFIRGIATDKGMEIIDKYKF